MQRIAVALIAALLIAGCSGQPKSDAGLPGSYTLPIADNCKLWIFTEESHVGKWALALACPGIDLMRVYPWPPVQPWDESPINGPNEEPAPTPTPLPPLMADRSAG